MAYLDKIPVAQIDVGNTTELMLRNYSGNTNREKSNSWGSHICYLQQQRFHLKNLHFYLVHVSDMDWVNGEIGWELPKKGDEDSIR